MNRNSHYYTASVVIITVLFTLSAVFLFGNNFVFPLQETGFSRTKKVLDLLDRYYLYDFDRNRLEDNALGGIAKSLGDPYTTYYNQQEYTEYNEKIQGKYLGIGLLIEHTSNDEYITIHGCMEDSPAQKAGFMPGDKIKTIDGQVVLLKDIDAAIERIKGDAGTQVIIGVYRPSTGQEMDIPVVREEISLHSVKSSVLQDGIGLCRFSIFTEGCDKEFIGAIEELKRQGIDKIIVDLRGNPGGLFDECVRICDYLLPKGTIVYTQDKNEKKKIWSSDAKEAGVQLAVLVDGQTASAAEIMSAALKDYQKAVIIGQQTFGKGVVQTTFELDGGTAVKMTVSEYFSPNGSKINKVGVTPDFVVALDEDLRQTPYEEIPYERDVQLQKAVAVMIGQ